MHHHKHKQKHKRASTTSAQPLQSHIIACTRAANAGDLRQVVKISFHLTKLIARQCISLISTHLQSRSKFGKHRNWKRKGRKKGKKQGRNEGRNDKTMKTHVRRPDKTMEAQGCYINDRF